MSTKRITIHAPHLTTAAERERMTAAGIAVEEAPVRVAWRKKGCTTCRPTIVTARPAPALSIENRPS